MLWRGEPLEWVWRPLSRWCVLPPCTFLVCLVFLQNGRRIPKESANFFSLTHLVLQRSFCRNPVLGVCFNLLLPSFLQSLLPVSLHPLFCLSLGSLLSSFLLPANAAAPIDWWSLFVSVLLQNSPEPFQSRRFSMPAVTPMAQPVRIPRISSTMLESLPYGLMIFSETESVNKAMVAATIHLLKY